MVIVGLRYKSNDKRSLIVFDPAVGVPDFIRQRAADVEKPLRAEEPRLMSASYFRSERELSKYKMLSTLTPLDGAIECGSWDLCTSWVEDDGTIVHATANAETEWAGLSAEPAPPLSDPNLTRTNSMSTIGTLTSRATGNTETDHEIA